MAKQRDWDGVLVGNIDLLGLETLQPLIDAAVPLLHHIGFVTPPFDPTHAKDKAIPSGVRQLEVKQNLMQADGNSTAPVVYPARVELYGSRVSALASVAITFEQPQDCFAGFK